jgi:hypothetical protein
MPKYQVELGRETNPDFGVVTVEAEDAAKARQKALDLAHDCDSSIEWTVGDETLDIYVTDVTELTPITPCTRVEVLVEGEEPDTLTLSALFYDQASINFSSQLDLVPMMQALADEGEYRTDFLTGYGSPATIRLKD